MNEVSGFPACFLKERFPTRPTGNMKRPPLQQTGRAGCHLLRPHSRPVQAPGQEGQETQRRLQGLCPATILPIQTRLPKLDSQAFFLRWLQSGNLSPPPPPPAPAFPLVLFGKFDQVASERAALGLKSKPELQLQESLPGFHGDGLWPPVPLRAEQGLPHRGRPRLCSMPRSTHAAGWLQTS